MKSSQSKALASAVVVVCCSVVAVLWSWQPVRLIRLFAKNKKGRRLFSFLPSPLASCPPPPHLTPPPPPVFFRCASLTRSSRHWRTCRSGAPCVVYTVCAARAAHTRCPTSSTLTKTRKRRRPCPRIIPWGWCRQRPKTPTWCHRRLTPNNHSRPRPHLPPPPLPPTQKLASKVGGHVTSW